MDLGTANTIIISDDKIVVDEPSVVALDRRTDKMIAVGEKAKMMYEKTHDNIRTIRPLRDGVIADFTACEQMMRGLIKMVHTGSRLFSPSLRMVIGVPSGSTEVELRAVRDSAEHHLVGAAVESHYRWLVNYYLVIADDDSVGGTQVHCYLLYK